MEIVHLFRKPKVLEITGDKHATFQNKIVNGLFTPPVKISERLSAWPSNEVQAINVARIAGKSDEEIKSLVASLVKQRQQAASVTA